MEDKKIDFKKDILSSLASKGLDWDSINSIVADTHLFKNLGMLSFADARQAQERLVDERVKKRIGDTIILCEHPPTITLGNRQKKSDLSLTHWEKAGVRVCETNRGGMMTYHAPGQLILYPVISLKERKQGVRDFLYFFLAAINSALEYVGLASSFDTHPAGVWIEQASIKKKIASCGLKIEHGVTNHGFSINLSTNLLPFKHFNACGQGFPTTSLERGYGACEQKNGIQSKTVLDSAFIQRLCSILSENLTTL